MEFMVEHDDHFNKSTYFKGKTSGYILGYELLNSKRRWNPIIKEIMKSKQNGKILDIGCAYGFLLKFLPNSFKKYGIELSEDAVLSAKSENPEADIYLGNFIKTKFDENTFDVITAFETLEHIPELTETIEKAYALLKKDSYFIVSFPIVESFLERKWFTMFDKTHINPSGKILNEIKRKFDVLSIKYTFECFKFILITKYRIFPVHQSYFIVASKKSNLDKLRT